MSHPFLKTKEPLVKLPAFRLKRKRNACRATEKSELGPLLVSFWGVNLTPGTSLSIPSWTVATQVTTRKRRRKEGTVDEEGAWRKGEKERGSEGSVPGKVHGPTPPPPRP
ncbi:hypothetical protein Naga_101681g1 [Nannochloropsis gaditana]|uniref:Uncharacterized protein n=1 Tax=Nannochloropsis gaditana TaxID=72520 RepID=W7TBD4_9STRA|nr:hypothetical protein Naga_101681g1 [Nannochloropsis gaditana]